MKLLEYEAKDILEQYGIPTAPRVLYKAAAASSIPLPCVVKSQVPVGGRGKAGGIRVVSALEELRKAADEIGALSIKGFTPSKLLCESVITVEKELYLSLAINRSLSCVELIAHKNGGVEVESNDQDGFLRRELTKENADTLGAHLAELYDLPSKTFALQDLLQKLYGCFTKNDALLLEINPLVLTDDNRLVAGDCKMELDNAAAFRHPEWDFEEKVVNANFVTLNPSGTIATIANGAGLAMATVDAVEVAGLVPANFLDIGGGATTEKVVASFRQIMEFKNINAIVINIFGGIVQCDTVARAIIEAREQLPHLPKLYIRLSGNRSEEAAALLSQHGLPLYSNLTECLAELRHES